VTLFQSQFGRELEKCPLKCGSSISFGCADAALIVSKDPALADVAATALGNAVQPGRPLEECFKAIDKPEIDGALVIRGEEMEDLLPWQTNTSLAKCDGTIIPMKGNFWFGVEMAARGINNNLITEVVCGKCKHQWLDGVRYQDITIVRCPECETYNKVNSGNFEMMFYKR
jgi:hypothetical protein